MIPLVAFLCLSLVMMGGLIWVDNSWAYTGGGQAGDLIQADFFFDGLDQDEIQELDADGSGMIPLAADILSKGNVGLDDSIK